MKKTILLISLLLIPLLTFQAYSAAKKYFRGEEMPLSEVKKRYGDDKFDAKKFRESTPDQRSKMAYSIITSKYFIGKNRSDVIKELGPRDGYYFSDSYPAYHIDENWKVKQDTWQILFLIDMEDKIKEVVVHKNCCDKK